MRTRRIGSLEVSIVGVGCNTMGTRLDAGETAGVVAAALEAGITFFDTADMYGDGLSEEYLGRALGGRRGEAVVATKFGSRGRSMAGGANPAYVRRALEDSLRRLGTDHVDLYQLHQPDPRTPIADTLAVLDDCVRRGQVVEIGCSNFSAPQLRAAEAAVAGGAARFVSVQNRFNLLARGPEAEVLPTCDDLDLAFLPYYPLANGLLTGKYHPGQPAPVGSRVAGLAPDVAARLLAPARLTLVERLAAYADGLGHSVGELAIAWLASRPSVASVIAGVTSPAQVRANAAAAVWELTPPELADLDRLVPGPGPGPAPSA